MVLFHLRQELLLNILTSFSVYCPQDVTVMLVESVGGDRLSGWARAERNTKPISSHWTSSRLDCCSHLFASTPSTSMHSISHASWSLSTLLLPPCLQVVPEMKTEPHTIWLSAYVNPHLHPPCSHRAFSKLHYILGKDSPSAHGLLFFQSLKSLLTQNDQVIVQFLSGLLQLDWVSVLFCTPTYPGSSPLEHCVVAVAGVCHI